MKKTFNRLAVGMLSMTLLLSGPIIPFINPVATVYAQTGAAVIRGSNINIRSQASTSSSVVTTLSAGAAINVSSETMGADGMKWYAISFSGGTGYVRSDFVRFPVAYTVDENFEAHLSQQGFPESYKEGLRQLHAQYPNWVFNAMNTGLTWNQAIAGEMEGTNSLVENSSISSWKSIEAGKFDWSTSTWPGFDGATWVGASQQIVEYYLDPRNFLDDTYVFQFAYHKFDANTQTLQGVKEMVKGTFLDKEVPIELTSPLAAGKTATGVTANAAGSSPTVTQAGSTEAPVTQTTGSGTTVQSGQSTNSGDETLLGFSAPGQADSGADVKYDIISTATVSADGPGGSSSSSSGTQSATATTQAGAGYVTASYAEIIMEAAQATGVNPYVLTSMIIQEQGTKGTSGSISGSTGYYNFFNVGAYAANGMGAVERGLWYASQSASYGRPWNTIEKAIVGGAEFFATNYTNAGQNTLYLKKWNVQGSNMFKHQYMTNVPGAAQEGAFLAGAYPDDVKQGQLVFSIPVFSDMPATPAAMPTGKGNPNNKLSAITVDGFTITPGFNMDTNSYTLVVDPSVTSVVVNATKIHSGATVSGTGNIALNGTSTPVNITVTAENGTTRNYTLTINQQSGGQTYNGALATGQTADTSAQTGATQAGSTSSPASSVGSGANVVEIGAGPAGS